MKSFLAFLVLLLVVGIIAISQSAFIVRQTEQAILLQFGEAKRIINANKEDSTGNVPNNAGLHWKIPFVQNVITYDRRVLDLDMPREEVIAAGQKRLMVDAFARFQIVNPLLFYKEVKTEPLARERLETFLDSSLRRVLGAATFEDVVRDKRAALMDAIREEVNRQADSLGIRVVDVRIKRADLPDENSEAVYQRMVKEREQEAAGYRAEGGAEANRIKATADRESTVIQAEANRKSEIMRGEADAERNRIFAEAFEKDPEFFAFYRSMQAYREGLGSGDTRMLISPDTDFFRYFGDPSGKPRPRATQ